MKVSLLLALVLIGHELEGWVFGLGQGWWLNEIGWLDDIDIMSFDFDFDLIF